MLDINCSEDSDQEWLTDEEGLPPAKKAKLLKLSDDIYDDGDDKIYDFRMKQLDKSEKRIENRPLVENLKDERIDGGLVVPSNLWNKLFDYQKQGVKWLWELHRQQVGGILADEMGLGKTIQLIVFFAALKYSKLPDPNNRFIGLGAVLIICPATIMHQWVKELHIWSRTTRAAILHSIGTNKSKPGKFVHSMVQRHGIVVTSYGTLLKHQNILLRYNWHYIVLDEGHKIRNPEAQITLVCKQFSSCHKIILSGSPIQNGLKELWSLFDFIFPGKLGTQSDFLTQFNVPIVMGGYSTASEIQVQTAYQCALTLRDLIAPYLLRRMKADVNASINLPSKNEQVLFCRLTKYQENLYIEYLESKECKDILKGKAMAFPGLVLMRKICNHPDLCSNYLSSTSDIVEGGIEDCYGHWERSGKMIVVESLLKLWKKQNHKVLFFTQSRQMLYIMENFVKMKSYLYLKMDGETSIGSRQQLVNKFNKDENIYIFLLTTKVGGLGINLTGADRVIIYDPDWNPSTDTQARERAWRIGQKKEVTIYRLVCSGTIEEKIYHRQIFKQFLMNRVLKDPRQRRFFKFNNLHELFVLNNYEKGTETSAIFAGTNSEIKADHIKKNLKKSNRFDMFCRQAKYKKLKLSDDKIAKMRQLAKKLSQSLTKHDAPYKNLDKSSNTNCDFDRIDEKDIDQCSNLNISDITCAHTSNILISNEFSSSNDLCNNSNIQNNFLPNNDSVLIEGENIRNCIKIDVYKSNHERDVQPDVTIEDDYVLHRLFKKTGIQGVMKHDKIMMSSSPDYMLIETEAKRVAKNAAKALEQSRLLYRPHPKPIQRFGKNKIKKPLETAKMESSILSEAFSGTSLISAGPTNLSSAEIFSILHRNDPEIHHSDLENKNLDLMKKVIDFVATANRLDQNTPNMPPQRFNNSNNTNFLNELNHDEYSHGQDLTRNFSANITFEHQATTKQLLNTFKHQVKPSDSATFKAILHHVCDFSKAEGTWTLKQQFLNLYNGSVD